MAQTFRINLILPNDLRQAIGDIAAFWSFLEWQVSQIMHVLLDLDPKRGRVISTQMNLRPRIEIVTLLLEHNNVSADIIQEFSDAKGEITRLQTPRNEIIHGLWALHEHKPEHYLLWYGGSPKNRIIGKATPMNAPHVRAIAAQIENVNGQLDRVLYGVRIGELPPLLGIS